MRTILLFVVLVLVVTTTTGCTGPNRAEELAVRHLAEEGGWAVIDLQAVGGLSYDVIVVRSRTEHSQQAQYLRIERCDFDSGPLKTVAPCRTLLLVETVPPKEP